MASCHVTSAKNGLYFGFQNAQFQNGSFASDLIKIDIAKNVPEGFVRASRSGSGFVLRMSVSIFRRYLTSFGI